MNGKRLTYGIVMLTALLILNKLVGFEPAVLCGIILICVNTVKINES